MRSGVGGIFWIPFSSFWGRAPVLFWTTLAGTSFSLGCVLAPNFETFYAMRALQGFTLTTCQMIGLSYIKDMFFFHQHARKIGLWASLFLLSPYLGPMFGYFIIAGTGEWRNCFWLVFAICCFDMLLIVLFADESWYRRDLATQPPRGARLLRLVGIWRFQAPKDYFMGVKVSYLRLFGVFIKPVVIPIMIYYGLSFMWAIGINITSSTLLQTPKELQGYGFSARGVGYIYFTAIVGTVLGELFGHFFNDYLANRFIRRHKGIFKAEARLATCYIATVLMIPGLVIVGQALQHLLHYSAIIIGWGAYVFGVMLASVAITTYALDCYPMASAEMGGYVTFARTISGFTVGYFQQPWGLAVGWGLSFGIQAIIVGAATILLALLHFYGEKLRLKGGPLNIKGAH
jgi:MFS family permease